MALAQPSLTAVSLFSSAGIADLALRAAGFDVLVASELIEERASLYQANFPKTAFVCGDIAKVSDEILEKVRKKLGSQRLDLCFATPPCQGMSKNGRGKLLSAVRAGTRPAFDPRNQLILDTIELVLKLRPRHFVLENVPEMRTTIIQDRDGSVISVMDYIERELSPEYCGANRVIEFADYGVPQRRQRLITIYTSDARLKAFIEQDPGNAFPRPTHSKEKSLLTKPWKSVNETIRHLPPLDAGSMDQARSPIPFHNVPLLDEDKYFWVSNTPPAKSAFDNQCVNPKCGYQGNPTHGASHDKSGINRAHRDTPIRCLKCSSLLPRPWVRQQDDYRLMSGYTSAYKRMRGDLPASALTRNLSYACSDQKVHPAQNRVLSLKEAFLLHTIDDFSWKWMRADGRRVSDKLIREVVGESVPPRGLLHFFQHIIKMTLSDAPSQRQAQSATA